MDDLTMDLVRLCRRNRDGSRGTQSNRQRGLTAMADDLLELGYKLPAALSLKPKHVEALVEKWLDDDKTDASIRNRLSWLRWWAEKIGKPNVVSRDNAAYGVAERGEVTRNRAQALDPQKFQAIDNPHIQASILLQVAFGLRREEAIKFRPQVAMRADHITLQGSWTKGGRPRTVPITSLDQRHALQHVATLVTGQGSLIPAELTYVEQLKRYEYETYKAGLRNTHSFRHAYAQRRYQSLTGLPCPLAGGKAWKEMTGKEREADRAARRQISAELGHGRLKITDTYLGRAFQ
ncbi:phage integrase N-terminal domain-containing protein [Rhizobium leguminosarum]|uniref:phage integrase N-terminal domain-containing protein n=1 Tax=Rhizobium leguminosarum TaxID=384 RepID=UPI001C8FE4C1|nr:phage integrase N-terminal domain-containing protein [Rhizobium leguminosarum]MBY2985671.1 integrase [Rhizobium leguminosarum]